MSNTSAAETAFDFGKFIAEGKWGGKLAEVHGSQLTEGTVYIDRLGGPHPQKILITKIEPRPGNSSDTMTAVHLTGEFEDGRTTERDLNFLTVDDGAHVYQIVEINEKN